MVLCGNDAITAVFDRRDLPNNVSINQLYLRDGRCRATYNSTHVIVRTPLSGCGTVYEEDEQNMFFTNILSETSSFYHSGITRDYLFKTKFICCYGRKRTVGGFSFEPARQSAVGTIGRPNKIRTERFLTPMAICHLIHKS